MVRPLLPSYWGSESHSHVSQLPGFFEVSCWVGVPGRPFWAGLRGREAGLGFGNTCWELLARNRGREGAIWGCESSLPSCFLLPGLSFPICKTDSWVLEGVDRMRGVNRIGGESSDPHKPLLAQGDPVLYLPTLPNLVHMLGSYPLPQHALEGSCPHHFWGGWLGFVGCLRVPNS